MPKPKISVLVLENDNEYFEAVRRQFEGRNCAFTLELTRVTTVDAAEKAARAGTNAIVIVDVALDDGANGIAAIAKTWVLDKKVIYVIHTVLPESVILKWAGENYLPAVARHFVPKKGQFTEDAGALFDAVLQALKAYVPYLTPALVNIQGPMNTLQEFGREVQAFRQSPFMQNMLWSQAVTNRMSIWASDRIARRGSDALRISVILAGSYARLEAGAESDADFFVVFDDRDLSPADTDALTESAYESFLVMGRQLSSQGLPVDDFESASKSPAGIVWQNSTLPTWFPLSSLAQARLGTSSQLELIKNWFLQEGNPVFNQDLFLEVRLAILEHLNIDLRSSVRETILQSSLPAQINILNAEFKRGRREATPGDTLRQVKHSVFRTMGLLASRLTIVRLYLDQRYYDNSTTLLVEAIGQPPIIKLIEAYRFFNDQARHWGAAGEACREKLLALANTYANLLHQLNSERTRWDIERAATKAANVSATVALEAAEECSRLAVGIDEILAQSSALAIHPQLLHLGLFR